MSTFNITITDTDDTVDQVQFTANETGKRFAVLRKESGDTTDIEAGENLMEVLKDLGFDVPGACGGMAACGTCHLAIEEGTVPNEMEGDEEFMLDGLPNSEDNSRLACQIPVVPGLDGLKARVLGDL